MIVVKLDPKCNIDDHIVLASQVYVSKNRDLVVSPKLSCKS